MTFPPLPNDLQRVVQTSRDAELITIDVEQVRRAASLTDVADVQADLDLAEADLLGGAFIDFDSDATGGNTGLTTSFQTALTHAYSPPGAWNTYKIQGEIWASAAGLTSGDQFQIVAQVTGGGAGTGTIVTDDAATTPRSSKAVIEVTGISGAIDLLTRVRNNTATRGTVYVAVSKLIAVRTS